MKSMVGLSLLLFSVSPVVGASDQAQPTSSKRPVVWVQPSDSWKVNSSVGGDRNVIVGTGHGGKEPQTAKIYQLLQHRSDCSGVAPNVIQEKADYVMLVEHGGGKGNRWAVSNKDGDVIGSGESFMLSNSVSDACRIVMKDWGTRTEQRAQK
jgi:hypothetical protein